MTDPPEPPPTSASRSTSDNARRDWYWRAMHADPERRRRFEHSLDRARTDPGVPDDMDEISRLLDGRT